MSKLQEFLNELTDSELASFHSYRYHQFMKGSQEKIDLELNKRGMRADDLEKYKIIQNPLSSEVCPQCGSGKFYTSTEIETVNYSYASIDLEVDYRTCLVCLYAEGKDESSSSHSFVGPFGFIKALINRKK